jgi:hypothetical protein
VLAGKCSIQVQYEYIAWRLAQYTNGPGLSPTLDTRSPRTAPLGLDYIHYADCHPRRCTRSLNYEARYAPKKVLASPGALVYKSIHHIFEPDSSGRTLRVFRPLFKLPLLFFDGHMARPHRPPLSLERQLRTYQSTPGRSSYKSL